MGEGARTRDLLVLRPRPHRRWSGAGAWGGDLSFRNGAALQSGMSHAWIVSFWVLGGRWAWFLATGANCVVLLRVLLWRVIVACGVVSRGASR